MSELDKLEQYLKENRANYNRVDEDGFPGVHRLDVFNAEGNIAWDAICQRGSYGFDAGLLEIYGELVDREKDGSSVVGWLTAEDVIRRIEGRT